MVRQQVNEVYGTIFSEWEIIDIIQFTLLRHQRSHANLTNTKSFPDLQERIVEACGICDAPWPVPLVRCRLSMLKAVRVYRAVVDGAAVRGVRTKVWDKSGKFTGWI